MNHTEVKEQMTVEQYLLDELSSEARDAFEEHMFDCTECAMDVCAGAAFVHEAQVQLRDPAILRAGKASADAAKKKENGGWLSGLRSVLRPAYLAPVFAALLVVIGYQNFVVLPGLRAANEPRVVAVTPLRGATRGSEHQALTATRAAGLALPVNLPDGADAAAYASYAVALIDPAGKTAWNATIAASSAGDAAQQTMILPGQMLRNGTYTVAVDGVDVKGTRTPVERSVFDLTIVDSR